MCEKTECVICLGDTSGNDYLELDCCKQIVHIECLNTWIKTNIHNSEQVKKCFYCKQNNDYINTIIYYIKLEEGITNINYDSDSNSLIEVRVNEPMINIRESRCFMLVFNFLYFLLIFTMMSCFVIIYHNNSHENRSSLSRRSYYDN